VVLLFFAGILFRYDDQPKYWQWHVHLTYLRYAWGAQMINAFKGQVQEGTGDIITINGQEILEYYGLDGFTAWEMLGYEAIFVIVFFVLAWLALQFKTIAKR
jgi:ATP-binding cassette, subfamily G (WHITE), member 2